MLRRTASCEQKSQRLKKNIVLFTNTSHKVKSASLQAQNTSKNDDLKNGSGKLFKINSRINYLHVLVTKTWIPGFANKIWLIYTLRPLCCAILRIIIMLGGFGVQFYAIIVHKWSLTEWEGSFPCLVPSEIRIQPVEIVHMCDFHILIINGMGRW